MSKQIITLSDKAANRIKEIMSSSSKDMIGVRVGVKSGGCAGMSYIMEYTKKSNEGDEIIQDTTRQGNARQDKTRQDKKI